MPMEDTNAKSKLSQKHTHTHTHSLSLSLSVLLKNSPELAICVFMLSCCNMLHVVIVVVVVLY